MQMNYFSLEIQQEEADFSDATTVWEGSDLYTAARKCKNFIGHRRLIGWLDLGAMRSPVELIRL